ncbi:unnamed protein product (macronuclear) [Paramecium tetraurelia]|uniref:WH2 domain-containing protein n=1 Tax=Paramecium tetraurelia TaxID=5888 RepID=A0CIX5_PARTE|nr:uncharacterized protein GSPATT00007877001 [Paramecium tetraurelia]CAK70742.1 unnamed protein product [Paramecium tetraurelia]|eukprot:XP_001438139.1 hypothetical protein (macronuclear) [Paramecium tetraurelia strain d4-2]
MQINGRLTSGDKYPEANIEKEAAEMASRIMERVRQKSNVKSAQRIIVKPENFRSSDYKPRPSDIQIGREGTTSITDRNELNFEPNFNQFNPLKNGFTSKNNLIETIKIPQRSQFKSASTGMQDIFQKTVKLNNNNYYVPEFQSQSTTDKPDSTKLIKLTDSVSSLVNQKYDLQAKHRRVESNTQFKPILNTKPYQLHTPVKQNKEDIVSQLLGSLRNQKKYSDYKNSAEK